MDRAFQWCPPGLIEMKNRWLADSPNFGLWLNRLFDWVWLIGDNELRLGSLS